jgi:hypothetical protein
LVRSRLAVVVDEFLQHALQMSPTKDQQVIQALSPRRPHPALGERVRPRRSCRCAHHLHAFAPEHLIEAGVELGVPVADQEPGGQLSILQLPGQVPRGLAGRSALKAPPQSSRQSETLKHDRGPRSDRIAGRAHFLKVESARPPSVDQCPLAKPDSREREAERPQIGVRDEVRPQLKLPAACADLVISAEEIVMLSLALNLCRENLGERDQRGVELEGGGHQVSNRQSFGSDPLDAQWTPQSHPGSEQ